MRHAWRAAFLMLFNIGNATTWKLYNKITSAHNISALHISTELIPDHYIRRLFLDGKGRAGG